MKPAWWMVGASVTSWLAVTTLFGARAGMESLCGMIGPLAAASGSWVLAERTYRRHPERMTSVMVKAFAAKMVLFPLYVAGGLRWFPLRPVPFVVSFTVYFIALHLTEAFCLQRMFTGGLRASR